MPAPPHAPPSRPRKWRRRFLILGGVMLLIAGGVAAVPTIASMKTFQPRLERQLSGALGARVTVRDYRFGWLSGARIDGLQIDQPPGFGADRPMLTLEHAALDVSWLRALSGAIDVGGEVRGVRLLVVQRKDGTLNVRQLGAGGGSAGGDHGRGRDGDDGAGMLERLRANLALRDVAIDVVHEEKGTLESIRKLEATVDKRFGSTDFDLDLTAELAGTDASKPPGKLQLDADVDGTLRRPIDVQLTATGFDFARYRPLLDAMLGEGKLAALSGVLDGTVKARIENLDHVFVQGALTVDRPRVAGALLQGMDVQAPKWVISPNVEIALAEAGALPRANLDGFSVDLGFLQVRGVGAGEANGAFGGAQALAFDFTVDLQALGKLGGPIPAALGEQPGSARGRVAVKLPERGFSGIEAMPFVRDSVRVDAKVQAAQLTLGKATTLGAVDLDVTLQDGAGKIALAPGASLNGGPLGLTASVDLEQQDWPASLGIDVKDSTLVGDAVHALQYAVPLFAGLAQQGNIDLDGKGTLSLALTGPGAKAAGDSWLTWLNRWSGGGKVALLEGSVRPAAAFASLLQLAAPESQGRLAFNDLGTDFTLRQGGVETALAKLDVKGRKIGIRGRTGLDGSIDHVFELTELLRGHEQGDKVLQFLQGKPIEARLTGTLAAPHFAMPDVQGLLSEALKNAARQEAQQGVEDLLQKGLEDLLKKKKE